VVSEGRLEGIITTRDVAAIPRADWDRHTVGEVMRHDVQSICIAPDADAMHALAQMQRTGSSRLLVAEDGHLQGIVSLKDLLRFLNLKMELHDREDETPRSEGSWRLPARHEENVPH
jgi:predicted transcriptional regulator